MTCVFPNCKESRNNEYHCKSHSIEAYNHYVKYKQFQERYLPDVRTFVFKDMSMRQLLHKYQLLGKLYSMRMKYQNRFLREEYWDLDHDKFLKRLQNMMIQCQLKVSELLEQQKLITESKDEIEDDICENHEDDEFWTSFSDETQLKRNVKKIKQYTSRVIQECKWADPEIQNLIQPQIRAWQEAHEFFCRCFQYYQYLHPVIPGTNPKNYIHLLVLGVKVVIGMISTLRASVAYPDTFWDPRNNYSLVVSCLIKDPIEDLFQYFWQYDKGCIDCMTNVFQDVYYGNMQRIFRFVNLIVFQPVPKAAKAIEKKERSRFESSRKMSLKSYYVCSLFYCWLNNSILFDIKPANYRYFSSESRRLDEAYAKCYLKRDYIQIAYCPQIIVMKFLDQIQFTENVQSVLSVATRYMKIPENLFFHVP